MSLLRFLATGKSLVGMKEITSRYRMRTPNLLPKFVSPKNPFAVASKTVPAKTAPPKPGTAAVSPVPAPASSGPEPVKMETAPFLIASQNRPPRLSPRHLSPLQSLARSNPPPRLLRGSNPNPPRRPPSPRRKSPRPSGWWVKKLNPLSYLPSRGPGGKKIRQTGARAGAGRAFPGKGESGSERFERHGRGNCPGAADGHRSAEPAPFEPAMTGTEPAWNRLTSGFSRRGQTLMHK